VYNTSCTATYKNRQTAFPTVRHFYRINSIPIVAKTIAMLRRVLCLPLPHQPLLLTILLKVSTNANGAVLADPRRLFWILHARNIFRFRESNFACRARLSNPLSSAITDSSPRLSSTVQAAAIRGIGMRATRESSLITETIERDTWETSVYILLCAIVRNCMAVSCHERREERSAKRDLNTSPGIWHWIERRFKVFKNATGSCDGVRI